MAQQPIEMILLHQWASYMAIPIGVIDVEGNLVYYNEPCGPPYPRGTPKRCEFPTAMSAPHSPGGVSNARLRRSVAAITSALTA